MYHNEGDGIVSRALLAMNYACVVVTARGMMQIVLAVGAGGSSQDSHTCIGCPNHNVLRISYILITVSLASLEIMQVCSWI